MITVMSPNEPTNKRLQVYREAMMNLAQMMCAPFWWSVGEPGDRATNILNNGTTCYVDTGTRKLGRYCQSRLPDLHSRSSETRSSGH
jgi:hypothetical protein